MIVCRKENTSGEAAIASSAAIYYFRDLMDVDLFMYAVSKISTLLAAGPRQGSRERMVKIISTRRLSFHRRN